MDDISIDFAAIGATILSHAPKILLALLVFLVGRWLAARLSAGVEKGLSRAPNADATLSRFFANLVRYALLLVTVIAALTVLGIDTTAMSGMVLGLGVAMAFILKDSLSDVAAGVMLMIFRPYNVGDEVEIDGAKGVVQAIAITATRMKTRDNIEMIVQNSKAWGGVIRNHNALEKRRLDMVFGVSYDADIDTAIQAITKAAGADPRVYADPAPWAKVVNLGESAVDIELRVWSDYNDMRNLKVDISQPVKAALDAAGVGIPYPHEVVIKQKAKPSKLRGRVTKLRKT